MENNSWDITCTKDKFNSLKSDPRFLALLTLARFVNALRFCQRAAIDAKNNSNPSGSRAHINSFLFASSVLYEGFKLAEKLGKHFKSLDSYKNGLGLLLKDKDIISLRTTALKRMRNRFVFHFDEDVALEALQDFQQANYRFATGIGRASGEMYFGLADEAVMNYLLQPKPEESDDNLKIRLQVLIQKITDLMGKFAEAAEKLMADVLSIMGWTVEIRE